MQGQPEMAYGGYLPKYAGDEPPYTGVVGTAYRDPNIDDYYTPLQSPLQSARRIGQKAMGTPNFLPVRQMVPNGPLPNVTKASNTPIGVYSPTYTAAPFITEPGQTSTKTIPAITTQPNNKKQPFDRWGEVGAMTTGAAALAKELSNINAVNRPGILQNVYLSPGVAPDKVDYTAEQEALNTDIAAAREANRLAGGNPAVLGQLRAEQLRRRGQIAQGQENANTELMNQYKRERTEAMQKSQAANADIAKENMYNDYGYNQWLAGQRNAAIAAGANTISGVFNNQTTLKNQLDAAQIMANAHPETVWSDTAGNKYVTIKGKNVPVTQKANGGMIYADGGSVYKQKLGEVLSRNTISKAKQMDMEYAQALKNKQNTYTSSITGLEYKVMPRSEKDLYAANLWKEAHGTAPTSSQKEATKKAIEGKATSSNKAVAAVENARAKATQESPSNTWSTEPSSSLLTPGAGSKVNPRMQQIANSLGVGTPDVKGQPSSNKFRAGIENELAKKNARYDLSKGVSKWEKPNIAETPKPEIQGQPWMGRVDQEQPIGKPSFKTETYGKDNTNVNMSPRAKGSGKATEAPIAAATRQVIQDIKSGSKNLPDVTANARMIQPNAEKAAAMTEKYAKKGYNAANEAIDETAKTVVPTSIRAMTKDIIRNNFGGNGEITEKDFTKSQLEAIRQLAQKKLELSKTKGSSTAVNSYNDYDKDLNGILSQWSPNKNIRNTLGKFNPIQDGDTLRIKEKYNFNEKENDKVVKEYLEWKNYWRQKGYSRPLAYFRSAGSTWGSPGSEYGDDSKGTPINIKIYNPKKKKA